MHSDYVTDFAWLEIEGGEDVIFTTSTDRTLARSIVKLDDVS